jgi:hypothetical protein
MTFTMLYIHCKTAFADPGILPRGSTLQIAVDDPVRTRTARGKGKGRRIEWENCSDDVLRYVSNLETSKGSPLPNL